MHPCIISFWAEKQPKICFQSHAWMWGWCPLGHTQHFSSQSGSSWYQRTQFGFHIKTTLFPKPFLNNLGLHWQTHQCLPVNGSESPWMNLSKWLGRGRSCFLCWLLRTMLASDKHWMVGWMVLYVKGQLHTFSLIISPYLKSNMLPHTHRMTPLSSVPLVLGGLWLKVEDLVSPDPPAS